MVTMEYVGEVFLMEFLSFNINTIMGEYKCLGIVRENLKIKYLKTTLS